MILVDGHVRFIKIYWDGANVIADHLEAWQYDPHWITITNGAETDDQGSQSVIVLSLLMV